MKSPQTALKYFNQLASSINSLNLFPERCPIVKQFIKLGIKIRRLNVNNYAVFYKYENNIVTILRVFHASSNLEKLIKVYNNDSIEQLQFLDRFCLFRDWSYLYFFTNFSFQVVVAMLQSCCL